MFGEYVRKGELLVYPFYEFTSFGQFEYKPAELGFGLDQDFRGKFREHEANFFLAYGVSDRVALELESALFTTASNRSWSQSPLTWAARSPCWRRIRLQRRDCSKS